MVRESISIEERARRIRAVALDGDGVIFSGHVLEGQEGPIAKIRSHPDGQGISLLRSVGIQIACVTGESGIHASFLERLIEKWNNLPSVRDGSWNSIAFFSGMEKKKKVEVVEAWLKEKGLNLSQCAAMGDDLTDYDILQAVGLAAAPAQAEEVIKKIVHFVAARRGGDGAIRDLANFILTVQGSPLEGGALR